MLLATLFFSVSIFANEITVTDEELDILRRITWAEARGEDEAGMIKVVNVIFNRKNDPRWPDTIRGIVFQTNPSVQFSPIANGSFNRAVPCERVNAAVERALQGADYSMGATFFRAYAGHRGSWHERALTRLFVHGGHIFYE